jgi:hypothetical protein
MSLTNMFRERWSPDAWFMQNTHALAEQSAIAMRSSLGKA